MATKGGVRMWFVFRVLRVTRVGWPDSGVQRVGRWWVWLGPYIFGWNHGWRSV